MRIIQTNEYYNDDRNHMILLFVFETFQYSTWTLNKNKETKIKQTIFLFLCAQLDVSNTKKITFSSFATLVRKQKWEFGCVFKWISVISKYFGSAFAIGLVHISIKFRNHDLNVTNVARYFHFFVFPLHSIPIYFCYFNRFTSFSYFSNHFLFSVHCSIQHEIKKMLPCVSFHLIDSPFNQTILMYISNNYGFSFQTMYNNNIYSFNWIFPIDHSIDEEAQENEMTQKKSKMKRLFHIMRFFLQFYFGY